MSVISALRMLALTRRAPFAVVCAAVGSLVWGTSFAQDDTGVEAHAQATYVRQYKPAFLASYTGPNSLRSENEWGYTFTSTIFLGARLGNTELYFNPEFV